MGCKLKKSKFAKRDILKGDYWLYDCSCGKAVIAAVQDVDNGIIQDCGCVARLKYIRSNKYKCIEAKKAAMYAMQSSHARRCRKK